MSILEDIVAPLQSSEGDSMAFFPALVAMISLQGVAAESPLQADDPLVIHEISDMVLMVEGFGGNATIVSTADGVFLVDSMMQPASGRLNAMIAERYGAGPRAAVNTHHHGDHSAGNDAFNAGGTLTIAHQFMRHRIANRRYSDVSERWIEPRPAERLPAATYEDEMTFYWGEDSIRVYHPGPAHTGGDSIVHAVSANVIATGDVFVHGIWPIIDVYAGGSVGGTISALAGIYALADAETVIVPGHGPLASRDEVRELHDILVRMQEMTVEALAAGTPRDEFVAADPFAALAPDWQSWFIDSQGVAGIFYDDLAGDE